MVAGFGKSSEFTDKKKQDSQLVSATDCEQVHQKLADNFKDLQDPRGKQGVLHPFISIVMIALLATIGGATGFHKNYSNLPSATGFPPRYCPAFQQNDYDSTPSRPNNNPA